MAQRNYLVSTTALSLTASGTTIGSGNTQSDPFVVARTLVRSAIGAGELLGDSQTWAIHYVVSLMSTPDYEMRLKLQRRNVLGVMQSESGYGTTRDATGTFDDAIVWTSGSWAALDELALVWEHRRRSGVGNKSATIDANGASYVDAPQPAGTPHSRTPSDSLSLSDSASPVRAISRSLQESLTTSDAFGRQQEASRSFADMLALFDDVDASLGGAPETIVIREIVLAL